MNLNRARNLRKNSTNAERKIWYELRARRFLNYKFKRQVCIGPYIADFVCQENKLIIEIDGGQHNINITYDRKRTFFLNKKGYRVLRFWNDEVLFELDAVLERIAQVLKGVVVIG